VEELFKYLFENPTIEKLAGGDINDVFKITDQNKVSVIKVNSKEDFPLMFEKEKKGLELLKPTFKTPEIYRTGDFEKWQFLEMEYFQESTNKDNIWIEFAEKLSKTHQNTSKSFGFEESNFIGSLVQINDKKDNWADFLIESRLNPMIEMAVNAGEVNFVEAKIIDKFYARIKEIYPDEKPALLHGDLWSGNFLSTHEGPVLIDPAVYYGHREMDLGMMYLFGGFDQELFDVYNELHPLEKDWKTRIEYNQLYPLLVHVNLFGRSYWEKVLTILKQFA
jgi:protein-ribulosamine 3-kinase